MADCHTRLGQANTAQAILNQAKLVVPQLNPLQSFTYHYLHGQILSLEKEHPHAIVAYKKALESLNGPTGDDTPYAFETIQAYTALSAVYTKNNTFEDWEKALEFSTKSIDQLEQLKGQIASSRSGNLLQDIFHEPYQIAVRACLQLNLPEKAFEFSERYRGNFLRQLAFRTNLTEPDSAEMEKRSLEIQLDELKKERFLRTGYPSDEQDIQGIETLDSSILALSIQLQSLSNQAPSANSTAYLTLPAIQQRLRPDEALLQFHWGLDEVVLFVVTAETFQPVIIPDTSNLAEKITELYRLSSLPYDLLDAGSTQENFEAWTRISHESYQTILSPAQSFIQGYQLIIVPDGAFCYLPFELLLQTEPTESSFFRSHNYLVRDYEIRYLHAASLLVTQDANKERSNHTYQLLALAPDFEGNSLGLQPLKNNVLESETILSKMGGTVLKGRQATEINYLQKLAASQIIHFSTHGILNDRAPEFSYLAFSEILDSTENEQLFISEINNEPTAAELIVLSACQTASGRLYQGEGLASIAQAFLHAGAQSLVASLWNVDDQETPTLMGHFYDGLKNGLDKPAALRLAQLAYLEKANHKKAHPYYWAGFVHFGNASPLEMGTTSGWSKKWLTGWGVAVGLLLLLAFWFWRKKNYSHE